MKCSTNVIQLSAIVSKRWMQRVLFESDTDSESRDLSSGTAGYEVRRFTHVDETLNAPSSL